MLTQKLTIEQAAKISSVFAVMVISISFAIRHLAADRKNYFDDKKREQILENSKMSLENNLSNILRKSLFYQVCQKNSIMGMIGYGNLNIVNEQMWQQASIVEDLFQNTFPALISVRDESYNIDIQAGAFSERKYIYKIKGLLSEINLENPNNKLAALLLATQFIHCTSLSKELTRKYLIRQCHLIENGFSHSHILTVVTWEKLWESTHHAEQLLWYLRLFDQRVNCFSEKPTFQKIIGVLDKIGNIYPVLVDKGQFPSYIKLKSFNNSTKWLNKLCQKI